VIRFATAFVLALLTGAAGASSADLSPEPSGYRMDDYRAPTPATLRGAIVLTTQEARALWDRHDSAFIDVLPRPPRPAGLPAATIWRPKPRQDIPGSLWLPDTGYGALAPAMTDYLADGLRRASNGDVNRMLVFYCLENCWMSWNAAKRALDLGYTRVAWYPEGTDGWTAADLPLEPRTPEPRPGE
jgi:PQQ-dependent catabolism-associated CXXCW motif protein